MFVEIHTRTKKIDAHLTFLVVFDSLRLWRWCRDRVGASEVDAKYGHPVIVIIIVVVVRFVPMVNIGSICQEGAP